MLRVVLDTNVFVSSLLSKEGPAAQVLDAWRDRKYLLIISPDLAAEITSTLRYPRIRRRYRIAEVDVQALLDLLEADAVLVPGTADVAGTVAGDPDDEIVLACAVDGGADLVVSGDQHLLALRQFRRIKIVTIRSFLEQLELEAG